MRSERNKKVITIGVLVVAVLVLAIGYAAFSSSVTVSSQATVTPSSGSFRVIFTSDSAGQYTNAVVPTVTPSTLSAQSGVINNATTPKMTNLHADFTEPGQKVVYNFYVYNAGEFDAYLTGIVYKAISGSTKTKRCTVGSGATTSLVEAACNSIVVKTKIGDGSEVTGSTALGDQVLIKKTSLPVKVTIEYLSTGSRADGPFSVDFGDVALTYSSVATEGSTEGSGSGTEIVTKDSCEFTGNSLLNGSNNNYTMAIGNEVACGSETFYVYEISGSNVSMIAKNNIYLGTNSPVQMSTTHTMSYADSESLISDYGTYLANNYDIDIVSVGMLPQEKASSTFNSSSWAVVQMQPFWVLPTDARFTYYLASGGQGLKGSTGSVTTVAGARPVVTVSNPNFS